MLTFRDAFASDEADKKLSRIGTQSPQSASGRRGFNRSGSTATPVVNSSTVSAGASGQFQAISPSKRMSLLQHVTDALKNTETVEAKRRASIRGSVCFGQRKESLAGSLAGSSRSASPLMGPRVDRFARRGTMGLDAPVITVADDDGLISDSDEASVDTNGDQSPSPRTPGRVPGGPPSLSRQGTKPQLKSNLANSGPARKPSQAFDRPFGEVHFAEQEATSTTANNNERNGSREDSSTNDRSGSEVVGSKGDVAKSRGQQPLSVVEAVERARREARAQERRQRVQQLKQQAVSRITPQKSHEPHHNSFGSPDTSISMLDEFSGKFSMETSMSLSHQPHPPSTVTIVSPRAALIHANSSSDPQLLGFDKVHGPSHTPTPLRHDQHLTKVQERAKEQRLLQVMHQERLLEQSVSRRFEAEERKVLKNDRPNITRTLAWLTSMCVLRFVFTGRQLIEDEQHRTKTLQRFYPTFLVRVRRLLRKVRIRLYATDLKKPTIAALRFDKMFNLFSDAHLQFLIDNLQLRYYFNNETIIFMGSEDDEAYVLATGCADVMMGAAKIFTLKAGMAFGSIGMISGEPRTASIVAREPLFVWFINRATFESYGKRDNQLGAAHHLINELRHTNIRNVYKGILSPAYLGTFPIFRGVSPETLEAFGKETSPAIVRAGTILHSPNGHDQQQYLLLRGKIRISIAPEHIRQVVAHAMEIQHRLGDGESHVSAVSCLKELVMHMVDAPRRSKGDHSTAADNITEASLGAALSIIGHIAPSQLASNNSFSSMHKSQSNVGGASRMQSFHASRGPRLRERSEVLRHDTNIVVCELVGPLLINMATVFLQESSPLVVEALGGCDLMAFAREKLMNQDLFDLATIRQNCNNIHTLFMQPLSKAMLTKVLFKTCHHTANLSFLNYLKGGEKISQTKWVYAKNDFINFDPANDLEAIVVVSGEIEGVKSEGGGGGGGGMGPRNASAVALSAQPSSFASGVFSNEDLTRGGSFVTPQDNSHQQAVADHHHTRSHTSHPFLWPEFPLVYFGCTNFVSRATTKVEAIRIRRADIVQWLLTSLEEANLAVLVQELTKGFVHRTGRQPTFSDLDIGVSHHSGPQGGAGGHGLGVSMSASSNTTSLGATAKVLMYKVRSMRALAQRNAAAAATANDEEEEPVKESPTMKQSMRVTPQTSKAEAKEEVLPVASPTVGARNTANNGTTDERVTLPAERRHSPDKRREQFKNDPAYTAHVKGPRWHSPSKGSSSGSSRPLFRTPSSPTESRNDREHSHYSRKSTVANNSSDDEAKRLERRRRSPSTLACLPSSSSTTPRHKSHNSSKEDENMSQEKFEKLLKKMRGSAGAHLEEEQHGPLVADSRPVDTNKDFRYLPVQHMLHTSHRQGSKSAERSRHESSHNRQQPSSPKLTRNGGAGDVKGLSSFEPIANVNSHSTVREGSPGYGLDYLASSGDFSLSMEENRGRRGSTSEDVLSNSRSFGSLEFGKRQQVSSNVHSVPQAHCVPSSVEAMNNEVPPASVKSMHHYVPSLPLGNSLSLQGPPPPRMSTTRTVSSANVKNHRPLHSTSRDNPGSVSARSLRQSDREIVIPLDAKQQNSVLRTLEEKMKRAAALASQSLNANQPQQKQ